MGRPAFSSASYVTSSNILAVGSIALASSAVILKNGASKAATSSSRKCPPKALRVFSLFLDGSWNASTLYRVSGALQKAAFLFS